MEVTITAEKVQVKAERTENERKGVRLYKKLTTDHVTGIEAVGYLLEGTYHAEHGSEFSAAKLAKIEHDRAVSRLRNILFSYGHPATDVDCMDLNETVTTLSWLLGELKRDSITAKAQLKGEQEARENDSALCIRALQQGRAAKRTAQEFAEKVVKEKNDLYRIIEQKDDAIEEQQQALCAFEQESLKLRSLLEQLQDVNAQVRVAMMNPPLHWVSQQYAQQSFAPTP